jgi:hypothetical protein
MADRPRIRPAVLFDHHHGLVDGCAGTVRDHAAQCPGRQVLALDLGAHHRREVPAVSDLQPGFETPAGARRQRVQAKHVARGIGDMVDVGSMQGDAPVAVISDHAIGQRTLRRPLLRIPKTRHAEKIPAFGPQGKARQEIGQRRRAAVAQGRSKIHVVGTGLERVHGSQGGLAPIANGPDHDAARAALEHVHVLIAVRPRRPVIGYEIGEHGMIAPDFAAAHRGHIDDGPARNAVRRRCLDRECEGQLLVDDRQIVCGPRLAVDDGSRTDDDPNRGLRGGTGQRRCEQENQRGFEHEIEALDEGVPRLAELAASRGSMWARYVLEQQDARIRATIHAWNSTQPR